MTNKLEVKLLGKFDVHRDGKAISIFSRPAQSLFAYLILSAGTIHRREKLAGMLWPDSLEETSRDNLRQEALSRPEDRERTLARAKALNGIGFMYWADIYPPDRRPELEEALSIGRELGDRWNIATALRNLGLLENIQGNYLEACSFLEQSLEIWRDMWTR